MDSEETLQIDSEHRPTAEQFDSPEELSVADDFPESVDSYSTDTYQHFLNTSCKHRVLTRTEEVELAKRIEKGDLHAKEKLITHNQKLVASNIRKYLGQGLEPMELVQEANIGLMRATEKFDWRKGYKFSTYATLWLKQSMQRALADKGRTIRLPVHTVEHLLKMRREERELERRGEELTEEQAAELLGKTVDYVRFLRRADQPLTSLDKEIRTGEPGASVLADFIADSQSTLPSDEAISNIERESLDQAFDSLGATERIVISRRYPPEGRPIGYRVIAAELKALGLTETEWSPERVVDQERDGLDRLFAAIDSDDSGAAGRFLEEVASEHAELERRFAALQGRGLNDGQLAERLGVHPREISHLRHGTGRGPSSTELRLRVREDDRWRNALGDLSDRDRMIIELHAGLDGGEERTYSEIADHFGIKRSSATYQTLRAYRTLSRVVGK